MVLAGMLGFYGIQLGLLVDQRGLVQFHIGRPIKMSWKNVADVYVMESGLAMAIEGVKGNKIVVYFTTPAVRDLAIQLVKYLPPEKLGGA